MENITLKEIIDISKGKLIYGNLDEVIESVSTDSKNINKNDIFIGIKGEKVDGSKFYLDALNSGAKGAIINSNSVDNIKEIPNKFVLEVDDSIKCLQQIAKLKREKSNVIVVAITGSVGKTSTKDMVADVLGLKYKVLKTSGNFNNHIGLPLTILKLKDEDALVLEMGMNHEKEIEVLSNIAQPDVGIITNVGTSHIGNLKSRENILKAKLEILSGFKKDSKLIINNDNDLLHKWYLDHKYNNTISVGKDNESDILVSNMNYENNNITFNCLDKTFTLNNCSPGYMYNALLAIATSKYFNIDLEKTKKVLEDFKLGNNRLEVIDLKKYTIISDCYNASYESIKEALNFLDTYNKRKIAVIGDMLELDNYSKDLHTKVGLEILKHNIDMLITVGDQSKYIHEIVKNNIKSYNFSNIEDAYNFIKSTLKNDDVILFKASNRMRFIDIINKLKDDSLAKKLTK